MLEALWRFRHFMWTSIVGDLRTRFVRSRLGLLWWILHPLAQATIFALVLGEVLSARIGGVDSKVAFPIYLMAGMAAWGLFSEIVNRCLSIFIEYAGPMKKIAFPRICLPLIIWGSALVNHLILLVVLVAVFSSLGHAPGAAWLVLPLGIGLLSMFAFGLGVLLGILNVFSRDVAQVMTVVMQVWFWLTPIVYMPSVLPAWFQAYIEWNPLVPLIRLYQDALLFNRWPNLQDLVGSFLMASTLVIASVVVFRRASPEIVDAV